MAFIYTPERAFMEYLRFKRGLLCCDEVSTYGYTADVLAIDRYKKHVIEYEFKTTSGDLKYAEKKKGKYRLESRAKTICGKFTRVKNVEHKWPHRFYYVMPRELFEKEKEYLKKQKFGVIDYVYKNDWYEFLTRKQCRTAMKNTQKYEVAMRDLLARCTSAYVGLFCR
jgi:hypothetical protein